MSDNNENNDNIPTSEENSDSSTNEEEDLKVEEQETEEDVLKSSQNDISSEDLDSENHLDEEVGEESESSLPLISSDQRDDIPIDQPESQELLELEEESAPKITDENWEESLNEKLSSKEMKKAKKSDFKKRLKQKREELDEVTQELVEQNFVKVFDPKVLPHTIIFIIGAILIGVFGGINSANRQLWIVYTAFLMIFGYFLMYKASQSKSLHESLFGEGKIGIKIGFTVLAFGIGFLLCYLWNTQLDPRIPDDLAFLKYQALFGLILAVVYFGWNIIQIWFIKTSLEVVSIQAEARHQVMLETSPKKANNTKTKVLNYSLVFVPLIFHILFTLLFLHFDSPVPFEILLGDNFVEYQAQFYYGITQDGATVYYRTLAEAAAALNLDLNFNPNDFAAFYQAITNALPQGASLSLPGTIHKFTPDMLYWSDYLAYNPQGTFFTYLQDVWLFNAALKGVLIWMILVVVLWGFTASHQIKLYKESKLNGTPNIFSPLFYVLFWVILWLKLFLIIRTYGVSMNSYFGEYASSYQEWMEWSISIVLMIITIFNMVRGFGAKIKNVEKSKITQYNLSLLMFLFVISYWGGQWSLIAGGSFASKEALSIGTNIIVVVVNTAFYFWYSGWILERRGFIRKTSFTTAETKQLLVGLSQEIKGNLLQTIENKEIITSTLNQYMLNRKIVLEKGEGDDAIVDTLEVEEERLATPEFFKTVSAAYNEAKMDRDNLEAAQSRLADLQAKKKELESSLGQAAQDVKNLAVDVDSHYETMSDKLKSAQSSLQTSQQEKDKLIVQRDALKIPTMPARELTDEERSQIESSISDAKQKQSDLESAIDAKTSQISDIQNEIAKIQPEYDSAHNMYQDATTKRTRKATLESQLETTITDITTLEADIVVLTERANDSQPLLDAAQMSFDTVSKEKDLSLELAEAKTVEAGEKEKLDNAEKIRNVSQQDVDSITQRLESLETQAEIKEHIKDAKDEKASLEKEIKTAQKVVEEKTTDVSNKTLDADSAKADLTTARTELDSKKVDLNAAEKQLQEATNKLQTGTQLIEDLENAQKALEKLKSEQDNLPSVAQAEDNLKTLQNRLKSKKSDLKEAKKNDTDGSNQSEIEKLVNDVDQLGVDVDDAKHKLKQAKSVASDFENAQKKISSLEGKQIDLDATQEEINAAKTLIEERKDALVDPQNLFNEKEEIFNSKNDQLLGAKNELNTAQSNLSQLEQTLKTTESKISSLEQALETRQKTETDLKNAQKALKENILLFEKAQANYEKYSQNTARLAKEYASQQNLTDFNWKIYRAEMDLKKAHKTFKEAIRSAEANVKACESAVEIAKQEKADFLASNAE